MGSRVKAVISYFDYTGNMVLPWAENGYLCVCVDLKHPCGWSRGPHENIWFFGGDALRMDPPKRIVTARITYAPEYHFASFFPPCTDVAVSGARYFKDKGLGRLIESLKLFKRSVDIAEELGCPYIIENPVSTVSTYWRKPDYMFHPHEYAGHLDNPKDEARTKKTCLWVGNGFVMPEHKGVDPEPGSWVLKFSPSDDRAALRSVTPLGFARAVYEANNAVVETRFYRHYVNFFVGLGAWIDGDITEEKLNAAYLESVAEFAADPGPVPEYAHLETIEVGND